MYQPKKYVTFTEKCDKYKSPIRGGNFKCGSKKRSESLKLMKNNEKIPIGHCHQNKPGEFPQCYQQKKPVIPLKIENNIPIRDCIYCHQNKPVKLGECLQCYQQKKQVTPSKIKNIPIGKCIHCHQNKPVKLGECLQCYQQKKQVTPSKIENIPIGECISCHQNKPVKLGECHQCYQQKKPMTPSNIPIGNSIHCHQNKPVKLGECQQKKPVTSSKIENIQQKKAVTPLKIENIPIGKCIHCHQNKPVKLGECLQCYQQKKPVAPSKIESIPIGECIHCHQNKPVKLGECLQCYQQKKPVTSSKIETIQQKKPVTLSKKIENIPIGECIHCHQNKPECPECKKRITDMNRMINDKICTRCHTKYQRRFDNFNNQIACKTCNEQNQKREMYNENGQWYCSLDCMYAKKILDEIGDMKNINKERINILVNRFTSTNKNAGSTYNLTSKMIMEKIEISMKQNKSNIENNKLSQNFQYSSKKYQWLIPGLYMKEFTMLEKPDAYTG
ncbi:hypothetical protein RhiirA4_470361 [Rhizophagus irregularis]|uniref:Uncharacterized protein n=1 Tax=Rhizophagus irregularis TaxID=588596 RepID=A0A2I1H146_9GLOM|nr:hypothetical protein RhiirA4_470361 [Rhizophagus irregularis]